MFALRSSLRSSFLTRLLTSVTLVASLSSAASAEIARVPPLPNAGAPAPIDAPHFAQPPNVSQRTFMPRDYVEPVLDRAYVRAALVKIRHRNLAAFRAYQKAGVFPSNTFQPRKLNVWRDADGHFCAAATIIRMSGMTELVDKVAEQNNFIRLADVTQGPLMDWILTSGFTQEEIAAIQEPFDPVTEPRLAPVQPTVDPALRTAENARLRAKYKQVDRMLVKNEKRDLDLAVDRLMKHPDLAWKIASAE